MSSKRKVYLQFEFAGRLYNLTGISYGSTYTDLSSTAGGRRQLDFGLECLPWVVEMMGRHLGHSHLSRWTRVCVMDYKSMEVIREFSAFYELARAVGAEVPSAEASVPTEPTELRFVRAQYVSGDLMLQSPGGA